MHRDSFWLDFNAHTSSAQHQVHAHFHLWLALIFCYPQIITYFKPTIKPSLQFPDVFKPLFLSREKTRPGKFLDFNIPSLICTGSPLDESHIQHHFKNQTATVLVGCISECLKSCLIIPACICVHFWFLANSSRNQATVLVISSAVVLR